MTAQRVINGCACPVIVVPHGYDPPTGSVGDRGRVRPDAERHCALRAAAAAAQMPGADLRVDPRSSPGSAPTPRQARPRAVERSRPQVEATLTDAIAELGRDVTARGEVMVDDPADALLSISSNVDLPAMGSRG